MNEMNTNAQPETAQRPGNEALQTMTSAEQRNRWIKGAQPRKPKFSTEEQAILGSSTDCSGCDGD